LEWGLNDTTVPGNNQLYSTSTCGPGRTAIGGACGHRDANSAAADIVVNYSGPVIGNARQWRCFVNNTSGSGRAIRRGVLCTTAPVTGNATADAPTEARPAGIPQGARLIERIDGPVTFESWVMENAPER
jgi:hypothetical protein